MVNKKERKKTLYPLLSNLKFLMKQAFIIDRSLLFASFIRIPVIVLLPLITTLLLKLVVELVSEGISPINLVIKIIYISGVILLLNLLNNYVVTKIEWRSFGNRFSYLNICSHKIMDMDYENIEDPDGQTKMQKAFNTISSNNSGTQQVFSQLVNLVSHLIGLVTYSAFVFNLNFWLVLLLFAMTVSNYYFNKIYIHWYHQHKDQWVPIDRKRIYIRNKAGDFEIAKDIRIYGMSEWFQRLYEQLLSERLKWLRKSEGRSYAISIFTGIINFIRDGVAYLFLINQIFLGDLTAGDFVFYFGIISQYSRWLLGLIDAYNSLQSTSLNFCDLREFLDIPDHFYRGKGAILPDTPPEITFKNVSFRYKNSDKLTLKNVNFQIKPGEKIALVGPNGAGKTTLIKILCGLYRPTEGEIIVGGNKIAEYNRDEFYTLFSAVFQDIHLLPISIAKNIALSDKEKIDQNKLSNVLKLSGLYEKTQMLPQKEDTLLLKSIQDHATDLSGGEKQKLALARAIYKQGNIMILDEPTAAIDPIAENEIYQKYNELTKDATSIFISHRLSSTRFCDRILFLENGEIVEEGTHDELINLNGKYAHMFDLQSMYYRREVEQC